MDSRFAALKTKWGNCAFAPSQEIFLRGTLFVDPEQD